MAPNLRTIFRPLLDELGIPETEFWEIERVGRMANLFEAGRTGPGGGTPATPQAVVMIVISLLAGLTKRDGARNAHFYAQQKYHGPIDDQDLDRLMEGKPSHVLTEEGKRMYLPSQPISGESCGLTGATTFGEALTSLLANPLQCSRIVGVSIVHSLQMARIDYRREPQVDYVSVFGAGTFRLHSVLLTTTTTIRNPFFVHLARRFASANEP
jgi:hypothetical protein